MMKYPILEIKTIKFGFEKVEKYEKRLMN